MSDVEGDLRATIDDVKADAEQLADIEGAKAALDPRDPAVDELSHKAEAIARRLVPKTVAQRELAAELSD